MDSPAGSEDRGHEAEAATRTAAPRSGIGNGQQQQGGGGLGGGKADKQQETSRGGQPAGGGGGGGQGTSKHSPIKFPGADKKGESESKGGAREDTQTGKPIRRSRR